jgi:nucleoside-diphosphate-sugar epimerase
LDIQITSPRDLPGGCESRGHCREQPAPVQFLHDNLAIAANVIHATAAIGVEKLLFLGSSCIYPKLAPQPIPEDALLTGPLEQTNGMPLPRSPDSSSAKPIGGN